MAAYRKFLIAALAGATVLITALADGAISTNEWYQIAAAVLGPLGVWAVPNTPKDPPPTQ